jgi:hypothetical protein
VGQHMSGSGANQALIRLALYCPCETTGRSSRTRASYPRGCRLPGRDYLVPLGTNSVCCGSSAVHSVGLSELGCEFDSTRFRQSPVESADLTPRTSRFLPVLALVLARSWPQQFHRYPSPKLQHSRDGPKKWKEILKSANAIPDRQAGARARRR